MVISNTLATVWIAYCGFVVKCARSQVRPHHDDDETAQEHVTEHMKKLGDQLLHDSGFSYEHLTRQDEPPVDSPPTLGESTVPTPPGPSDGDNDIGTR